MQKAAIRFLRTISASNDYQPINGRYISLLSCSLRDTRRPATLCFRDTACCSAQFTKWFTRRILENLQPLSKQYESFVNIITLQDHLVEDSGGNGFKRKGLRGRNVPFSPSENDLSPVGYKMLFKIALRRHLLLRCSFTNFLLRVS